jgi:hypothetical protein
MMRSSCFLMRGSRSDPWKRKGLGSSAPKEGASEASFSPVAAGEGEAWRVAKEAKMARSDKGVKNDVTVLRVRCGFMKMG